MTSGGEQRSETLAGGGFEEKIMKIQNIMSHLGNVLATQAGV